MVTCTVCEDRILFNKRLAKLPPRHRLYRAEMKYLQENGWVAYCGVLDYWGDPQNPWMRYTHEGALRVQKERDPG